MNLEVALNDLYAQLESAQAALETAQQEPYVCRLNRPGRCAEEADRVRRAENRIYRIELELRRVEAEC
jgi:hypothetical protein